MIEGSQIQLQNVNTLNPDSILRQKAATSQPARIKEADALAGKCLPKHQPRNC
jgi:hypothetical protein